MKGVSQFHTQVWKYYAAHKRALPWRAPPLRLQKNGVLNPYRILVSEIMLQQTQVERVIPYYREFISHFPSVKSLASARQKDVLVLWQGLGYNRRARMLHQAAGVISKEYKTFPRSYSELVTLPGIGPYTAGALCVFAYNQPVPIIETNIRTVYLHHFFPGKVDVTDRDVLSVVEKTLYTRNPREWFWALMDYGTFLKREKGIRNNMQSAHHTTQTPFEGSRRQVRGAVVRHLLKDQKGVTAKNLYKTLLGELSVPEETF